MLALWLLFLIGKSYSDCMTEYITMTILYLAYLAANNQVTLVAITDSMRHFIDGIEVISVIYYYAWAAFLPSPTFTLANINPDKMSTIASIFHHVTISPVNNTEVAIPNMGTSKANGTTLEVIF